jgi:hypothetical protein
MKEMDGLLFADRWDYLVEDDVAFDIKTRMMHLVRSRALR